jgi:TRAP-type C4-dicarboxylate transport system permease small subunit
MEKFLVRLTSYMSVAAGIILIFMAALTFADIIMRIFGRPIPGVYEVVGFLGVAVAAFVLPRSSLERAHVGVDMVYEKLSPVPKLICKVSTRILVAIFFFIGSYFFIGMAQSFIATKSVTMTLKLPFYPVVFVLMFGFLVQALVSVYQIVQKEVERRQES